MSAKPEPPVRQRRFLGVPLADALWLFYLVFLGLQPLFDPDTTWRTWALVGLLVAVFLPVYGFTHRVIEARPWFWQRGVPGAMVGIAIMAALTLAGATFNTGASVFAIYAGAAAGRLRPRQHALRTLVAIGAVLVVAFLLSPAPWIYRLASFAPAAFFVPVTGLTNLAERERRAAHAKLRMAQEEVEQLATIAERERIARDLHDLLGHTLSTITLKAELASSLATRDPERAAQEMRDVERLSRETLAEVRAAVRGYRGSGLAGELANAKLALEAAGVELDYFLRNLPLQPAAEGVFALALREAVTNVVRHSQARSCRVTLDADGAFVLLTVEDDGAGAADAVQPGSGLSAMQERVRALGGFATLEPSRAANQSGMRLDVGVPVGVALRAEGEEPARGGALARTGDASRSGADAPAEEGAAATRLRPT